MQAPLVGDRLFDQCLGRVCVAVVNTHPAIGQWLHTIHARDLLQATDVRCIGKCGDQGCGIHALFQSGRGICEHQFAVMNDLHPVTGGLNLRQNVSGDDNAVILAQFPDQCAYLADLNRVESDRGLIKDDHRRGMNDGLCDTDTLLITFRQVADQAASHITQSTAVFRSCDCACCFASGYPVQPGTIEQEFVDGEFTVYRWLLG